MVEDYNVGKRSNILLSPMWLSYCDDSWAVCRVGYFGMVGQLKIFRCLKASKSLKKLIKYTYKNGLLTTLNSNLGKFHPKN